MWGKITIMNSKQKHTTIKAWVNHFQRSKLPMSTVPFVIVRLIEMFYPWWHIVGVGRNFHGQFGVGDTNDLNQFLHLYQFSQLDASQIYFGLNTIVVKDVANQFWKSGKTEYSNLFQKFRFPDITMTPNINVIFSQGCSSDHALFCFSDCNSTQIYGFGRNQFSQMGIKTRNKWVSKQNKPHFLSDISKYFSTFQIIQIECGSAHSLFLEKKGMIHCLGNNDQFQCGINFNTNPCLSEIASPTLLKNLFNIIKINVGCQHNLCIDSNKHVWIFGANEEGQLGIFNKKDTENIKSPMINIFFKQHNALHIHCGSYHSLVINNQNICFLFGWNIYSQIGQISNPITTSIFVPFKIQSINSMQRILIINASLGHGHSLLLSTNNNIISFGNNEYFQCSTFNSFNIISTPYHLPKIEINVNSFCFIEKLIAADNYSIFICNEAHFCVSNHTQTKSPSTIYISKRKFYV